MFDILSIPGMTYLFALLIVMGVVSFIVTIVLTLEFHRIVQKRLRLLHALTEHTPEFRPRYSYPLIWMYVGGSITIIAIGMWLFLYQPHIL